MPETLPEETCPLLDAFGMLPSILHASVCAWVRVDKVKGSRKELIRTQTAF